MAAHGCRFELSGGPLPRLASSCFEDKEFNIFGRSVTLKDHMHVCTMIDPGPRPHVGGPVVSTSQTFVCVDGVP
ncbi:PAAR motif-containing protein (plasmid) [Rhizobium etli 8C-3]|nr:PAAR motif-containing protein [Rhizobium etli 8C-3]